jgi:hypothetical protein
MFKLGNTKHQIGNTNHDNRNKFRKVEPVKKVFLFTNIRDEKNMKEWCAHHLLLGFDNIFIFDHKSTVPLSYEFVNFDKRVCIERCELENPVKITLMKKAVKISKFSNVDWMLYLDADEYLVLNTFNNVKDLLNVFSFADSLSLNWLFFGTNNHVKTPENGLVIENFTRSDLLLNKHVKTFVRPKEVINIDNPHFYHIFNPIRMLSIENKIMNKNHYYAFYETQNNYKNVIAYIAHYQYQSEETYIKRKVNRAQDDGTGERNYMNNIHSLHNENENNSIKDKYSEKIKFFLKQYEIETENL